MTTTRPVLIDAQVLQPGDAVWHVDALDAFERLTIFHKSVTAPSFPEAPEVIERIEDHWSRGWARFFYVGSDTPEDFLLSSWWPRPPLYRRILRRLGITTRVHWVDELWAAPVWASLGS